MCKHTLMNKIIRTKKYDDEILVDVTFCETCGEIFKGTVKIVQPIKIKKYVKKRKPKVKKPLVTIAVEKTKEINLTKPEVKEKSNLKTAVKKQRDKMKSKKEINPHPRKLDTEIRKNSRKPSKTEAPDGANLADILRAKYEITTHNSNSSPAVSQSKRSKSTQMKDAYDNDLDNYNDLDAFVK